MFTIPYIPRIKNIWGRFANKKCMWTDCQYKMHKDTLPIKNAWGQIANTKYMGTLCLEIANKQYMGTLFQYCLQIYIYTHKIKTMHGMRTGLHSTLYI
jgi:hypothetical protein